MAMIGNCDLTALSNEQLERLAMNLVKDGRRGLYKGAQSVLRHKLNKIRREWDRRNA